MQVTIFPGKKEMLNTFLLALLYGAAFYGLQFFLHRISMVPEVPTAENLCVWDAGWYKTIVIKGYEFNTSMPCDSGFFYLFAAVWKLSHLDALGVSFLNIIFFASGFSLLAGIYKLSVPDKLLWLSVP